MFPRCAQWRDGASGGVLGLWLFSLKTADFHPITAVEKQWSSKLGAKRSIQYQISRGYARKVLSEFLGISNLEIPLHSPPGKPPKLINGFGYISISHCKDALLIGWSSHKIGVDLERIDRPFEAKQISNRYYSQEEQKSLKCKDPEEVRKFVLQIRLLVNQIA